MKTDNQPIGEVLAKNATSFFIPPFQRAYAWGRQEIERYFSDVSRIIESELDDSQNDKLEHFFGALVIKPEKDGFASRSVVVDGQQRLTTTLILLIALRDLEEDVENKEHITNTYLTNSSSSFQDKIKLKQVTRDWDSYKALVNSDTSLASGVIRNAYLLFTKLISAKSKSNPRITLHHYITAIERMNVAVIFLDERPFKGEDPQIIFETLNSLGRPLTLSDLVRNYVLLNMNSRNQSDIYENTWHPKVELVLNESTSAFLRDYLQLQLTTAIKAVSDNNTKEIYHIFKDFVTSEFQSHTDFISDIVPYAEWYSWIIQAEHPDAISNNAENNKVIKELIRNIFHDIKAEAFKPLVLGLLQQHQSGNDDERLGDERFIYLLQIIRTYLIRRRILGLTQGENKEMPTLCKNILSIVKGDVELIELLSNMFYRLRFPNDTEMLLELVKMNFYELKKYAKFILGKMEESVSKVPVDFRNPKITIEHIMPQKLDPSWMDALGENSKEIHEKYLHNIGNLILTEFNSEMGNKSFADKKAKLTTSNLNYRCFVLEQEVWNEASIDKHLGFMCQIFFDTFPLPYEYKVRSNWNTKEDEAHNVSPLDPEIADLVEGRKPIELRIEEKVIKVKSWQDILIRFLKYIKDSPYYDFGLILEKQSDFAYKNEMIVKWSSLSKMIEENDSLGQRYKTLDGKFYYKLDRLIDNIIFVHINISATGCMRRIANIMSMYNISEESVEIVLK